MGMADEEADTIFVAVCADCAGFDACTVVSMDSEFIGRFILVVVYGNVFIFLASLLSFFCCIIKRKWSNLFFVLLFSISVASITDCSSTPPPLLQAHSSIDNKEGDDDAKCLLTVEIWKKWKKTLKNYPKFNLCKKSIFLALGVLSFVFLHQLI